MCGTPSLLQSLATAMTSSLALQVQQQQSLVQHAYMTWHVEEVVVEPNTAGDAYKWRSSTEHAEAKFASILRGAH
jgi:hypothetical protein